MPEGVKTPRSQAGLAQVAERCPLQQKVAGSIPRQDMYPGFRLDPWSEKSADRCCSLSPFLSMSLVRIF